MVVTCSSIASTSTGASASPTTPTTPPRCCWTCTGSAASRTSRNSRSARTAPAVPRDDEGGLMPTSQRRAAALQWQQRRALLIGLTAAAGWLDALAWIYLGKVFLSFMSGNLVFLGIAAGPGAGGL